IAHGHLKAAKMIDSFQINTLVNLPVAGDLDFGFARALRSMLGHLWTVGPALKQTCFRRRERVAARPFQTVIHDRVMGPVRLTGFLEEPAGADSILLIVHGSGGNADSPQLIEMARAASDAGIASLRLSLRGADLSGDDIYHGGLTED